MTRQQIILIIASWIVVNLTIMIVLAIRDLRDGCEFTLWDALQYIAFVPSGAALLFLFVEIVSRIEDRAEKIVLFKRSKGQRWNQPT